jgi:sporulation protein YlmC with PRC-barrel domain
MLRSMNDLKNYAIRATDGDIGRVKDFYFDDKTWAIRYLIVDTATWLSGRMVLMSPRAIGHSDWAEKVLSVSITKEQVKNGPDIDEEKPVSRQYEMGYLDCYSYAPYREGIDPWSGVGHLDVMRRIGFEDGKNDPHLRSCKTVIGYHIEAIDGEVGHVQDILVDEDTWVIRHLIVDTSNWWIGNRILIAPENILKASWPENIVAVNLTRQAVKDAAPYDPVEPMSGRPEAVFDAEHDHTSTFV